MILLNVFYVAFVLATAAFMVATNAPIGVALVVGVVMTLCYGLAHAILDEPQ